MFLQVEVIDAEEGDHGPGKNRAPLRLGRQEDFCLRAQRVRRADIEGTSRGAAAGAAWIVRGDGAHRGRELDIPWARVAATPRVPRG